MKHIAFLKIPLITLICSQLFISEIRAQDDNSSERAMIYSFGYSNFHLQDNQISPLVYKSHFIPLQVGYQRQDKEKIFATSFSLAPGLMRPTRFKTRIAQAPVLDDEGNWTEETFNASYLPIAIFDLQAEKLVATGNYMNNRVRWYTGGQIDENFLFGYSFLPFCMNQLSIKAKTLVQYEVNDKLTLEGSVDFPLISLISRNIYSLDPYSEKIGYFLAFFTKGTQVATVNTYQKINLDLSVQKHFKGSWTGKVSYNFMWMNHSPKEGIRTYNNGIKIHFIRTLNLKS